MKLLEVLPIFPYCLLETADPDVHSELHILADRRQHQHTMSLRGNELRVHGDLYKILIRISDEVLADGLTSESSFTRLLAERILGEQHGKSRTDSQQHQSI